METYMCLPNLLAGGLPAGALPGLALAADKRAQHTHATQKSTAHAHHTTRDVWVCAGDITAASTAPPSPATALRRAVHIDAGFKYSSKSTFDLLPPCASRVVCCAVLCVCRCAQTSDQFSVLPRECALHETGTRRPVGN